MTLTEARLQLHYALQPLASATNYLTPEPEAAHTALVWNTEDLCIQTKQIEASSPFVVSFDPQIFSLSVTTAQDIFQFNLKHKTLVDAFNWLRMVFAEMGIDSNKLLPLSYPTYDFPFHPLALGGIFVLLEDEQKMTLVQLFNQSFLALTDIVSTLGKEAPIGLYPHHFDLAVLFHYGESSIGVGFSPGDRSYDRPYWYVSPYPYPQNPSPLMIGHWHTQDWTGAVMTWEEGAKTTEEEIKQFFTTAIKSVQNS